MKTYVVTFQPSGQKVSAVSGDTLFLVARRAGTGIVSLCSGNGACGKCRVFVERGRASGPTTVEEMVLGARLLEKGYRLACQVLVQGDLEVRVPLTSCESTESLPFKMAPAGELLQAGLDAYGYDPPVKAQAVTLEPPTLADPRPDQLRLQEALGSGLRIAPTFLPSLSGRIRSEGWCFWAVVDDCGQELMDVRGNRKALGLALDLGTTSLAGYLHDLSTGELVGVASILNPQVSYGEDVVTRTGLASGDDSGAEVLTRSLVDGINKLIFSLCQGILATWQDIYDVCVVGNTFVIQSFLGLDPQYLSRAPYVPTLSGFLSLRVGDLRGTRKLTVNPAARLNVLPVIGGYVGADTAAAILSTRLRRSSDLSLLVDVGTNCEVVLGDNRGLLTCSASAGSAFEGVHITSGMRAAPGAINRLRIDAELGVTYSTVGGERPVGICGSGILDALAELTRLGVIDHKGKFDPAVRSRRLTDRGFLLAAGEETATGEPIILTRKDVEEVQKAKAGIFAGIRVLMKEAGITTDQIKKIYLAGTFGATMDPQSAVRVGLIPDIGLERVEVVGNAAGIGARLALLSTRARAEAADLPRRVRYVELGSHPEFPDQFIEAMFLPHRDLGLFPSVRIGR